MPTIEFKRDLLIKARDRGVFTPVERARIETLLKDAGPSVHTTDIRLEDFPEGYWRAMLDDSRFTANQRAMVARYVFGMEKRSFDAEMLGTKSPNCELYLNGRWYPVIVNYQFTEDEGKIARDVYLNIELSICEMSITRSYYVYRVLFSRARQPVAGVSFWQVTGRCCGDVCPAAIPGSLARRLEFRPRCGGGGVWSWR